VRNEALPHFDAALILSAAYLYLNGLMRIP
jgi:hypothetical protein